MKRYLIYMLLLIIPATVFAQKVYKWTDKNGKTHYGDKPGPATQNKKIIIKTNKATTKPTLSEDKALPEEAKADKATTDVATQPNLTKCIKLAREMSDNNIIQAAEIRSRSEKLLSLCPNTAYNCVSYSITPSKNNCIALPMKPGGSIMRTIHESRWVPD